MNRSQGSLNNSNNRRSPHHNPHNHPIPRPTLNQRCRIYVGDLAFFCNESHLRTLFSQYGTILDIQLMRNAAGQTQMHAYIDMQTEDEARRAEAALDGQKLLGRKIRVVVGGNNSKQYARPERNDWVQVHISFVSRKADPFVDEEHLAALFSRFGEVLDITIKKHNKEDNNEQNGYGFAFFRTYEEANRAVQGMRKIVLGGITYDCALTHRSMNLQRKLISSSECKVSGDDNVDDADALYDGDGEADGYAYGEGEGGMGSGDGSAPMVSNGNSGEMYAGNGDGAGGGVYPQNSALASVSGDGSMYSQPQGYNHTHPQNTGTYLAQYPIAESNNTFNPGYGSAYNNSFGYGQGYVGFVETYPYPPPPPNQPTSNHPVYPPNLVSSSASSPTPSTPSSHPSMGMVVGVTPPTPYRGGPYFPSPQPTHTHTHPSPPFHYAHYPPTNQYMHTHTPHTNTHTHTHNPPPQPNHAHTYATPMSPPQYGYAMYPTPIQPQIQHPPIASPPTYYGGQAGGYGGAYPPFPFQSPPPPPIPPPIPAPPQMAYTNHHMVSPPSPLVYPRAAPRGGDRGPEQIRGLGGPRPRSQVESARLTRERVQEDGAGRGRDGFIHGNGNTFTYTNHSNNSDATGNAPSYNSNNHST